MGLFDFTKNFGKKIFGDDDEEASEKLQAHIQDDNPGVEGLQVTVEDGVATITGEAESQTAYEKAVLMAGNALGVESVEAAGLTTPEPEQVAEQEPEQHEQTQVIDVNYYDIQEGDSLWKIAEQFYGNGSQYEKLFDENREVIVDPDLIFPGQKIRIPMD